MTKNVKLIGIPENNFLCIFILASSPGVHTFFCLWRVNKKLPQGETSQNAFQRSMSTNQSKVKNIHVKMGISPLRALLVRRSCTEEVGKARLNVATPTYATLHLPGM